MNTTPQQNAPVKRRRGRRPVAETGPDPVDIHVGGRLRERRLSLGWSQSQLGRALNLTFQQIQKYERGANRVSASVLYRAAESMSVPVSFFFDGLHNPGEEVALPRFERETDELSRMLGQLPKPVQRKLNELVRTIAKTAEPASDDQAA